MFSALERIFPKVQSLSRHLIRNQRLFHKKVVGFRESINASRRLTFAGVAVVGGYVCCKEYFKRYHVKPSNVVNCQDIQSPEDAESITLYQFASCPFCNKVRTFLDYYGIKYTIVEVDPIFKKEIKFSKYSKVPIVVIQGIQLNDSSLIISILRTYLMKQDSLEQLLKYYPPITVQGPNNKETVEYGNRYGIMYKEDFSETKLKEIKLERKWRRWVDDTFVHTLSPNIYRTWHEAMEASEYFSDVGDFSATQTFLAKYVGAVVMYYIGKKMKKKYRLKDDVREAMYDEVNVFLKALGKRKFLGGKQPNLADLAMFGVLRGIEGLSTVEDLKKNTAIKPWFDRMKRAVESHQGTNLVKL